MFIFSWLTSSCSTGSRRSSGSRLAQTFWLQGLRAGRGWIGANMATLIGSILCEENKEAGCGHNLLHKASFKSIHVLHSVCVCVCGVCRCFCVYLLLTEEPGMSCGLRAELIVSPVHTFQLPLRRLHAAQQLRLLLHTGKDKDDNRLPYLAIPAPPPLSL